MKWGKMQVASLEILEAGKPDSEINALKILNFCLFHVSSLFYVQFKTSFMCKNIIVHST